MSSLGLNTEHHHCRDYQQTHPEVQEASVLTSEPADLVEEVLAGGADVYPHALPPLLDDPGEVGRVGHDAIVWYPGAHHHSTGRATELCGG